ncbi:bifunctional phosphoserine phosphatase/homoserine phosphotransferase ThrH [Alphaproteobacteria bacterium]|nr:bifunctional phosphoserine phosphatase/homoserine phosphotransferase ThrH [Alphaproteobacteria bacterium]
MRIICLDLEGVLVPEIWVSLAERTKIKDLFLTTRDIEDYSELMDHRLKVFKREGLKIEDIHKAVNDLEPFDGAKDFLDTLSKDFQVVILSDTFYEIASPLFNKLGNPTVFCHHLDVSNNGEIEGYKLRIGNQKQKAVEAFHKLGFSVFAAGDSYNDIGMLQEADLGVLFSAPSALIKKYKNFKVAKNYSQLKELLTKKTNFS